jgi:hypothetical protein
MANTFRQRKQEIQAEEQPQQPPPPEVKAKPKPRPQRAPKRTVQNKTAIKGIKLIRKGFESVFGGGILQKINIRKNWGFILTLVAMIIVLIYSNLRIQSKRQRINKLIEEVIVAKDEAMDAIEEGYNIDKQKERELLQEGEEKGFYNSGYIPYTIKIEEKHEKE